jgi:hypothetical protein
MGLQINIGDHTSSVKTYIAFPNYYLSTARWARTKANEIAGAIPNANRYFRGLSYGRSLSELLGDSSIWVNYGPGIPGTGQISPDGKEIAIGPKAFNIGRWTVLAALIHELAHSNGAPGGDSTAAEQAVLA